MRKIWTALFGRRRAIRDALETAFADQVAWEKTHPVPYTRDQRILAIAQRAERILREARRRPPRALLKLVNERIMASDETKTSTCIPPYQAGAADDKGGR